MISLSSTAAIAVVHSAAVYTVPKDTSAMYMHHIAQTNKKNFHRPHDFLPERWLAGGHGDAGMSQTDSNDRRLVYAPFGFGRHRCFGQQAGTFLVKAICCQFVQRYRIELLSDVKDAKPCMPEFALQPMALTLRLIPRNAI